MCGIIAVIVFRRNKKKSAFADLPRSLKEIRHGERTVKTRRISKVLIPIKNLKIKSKIIMLYYYAIIVIIIIFDFLAHWLS